MLTSPNTGYSAHLRTGDSGDEDGAPNSDSTFDKETWYADGKLGETMRFYQKPTVCQYFHKRALWRAREAQEVASYEQFIDLLYVGTIAITGHTAAKHPDGQSFLRPVISSIMGWKFWSDINLLISWIDGNDVLRRCSVLFILTCLLGFTTNMVDAFKHKYTPLIAFYVTARLYLILSLYLFGGFFMITAQRSGTIQRKLHASSKERLGFFPGTNTEHRIERTNAHVTLVCGFCVLGILYQRSSARDVNAFFGKAVLGLIQAFTFNCIDFDIESFNLHTHAIRHHVWSVKVSSPEGC